MFKMLPTKPSKAIPNTINNPATFQKVIQSSNHPIIQYQSSELYKSTNHPKINSNHPKELRKYIYIYIYIYLYKSTDLLPTSHPAGAREDHLHDLLLHPNVQFTEEAWQIRLLINQRFQCMICVCCVYIYMCIYDYICVYVYMYVCLIDRWIDT